VIKLGKVLRKAAANEKNYKRLLLYLGQAPEEKLFILTPP
jgi:hypothetical protein